MCPMQYSDDPDSQKPVARDGLAHASVAHPVRTLGDASLLLVERALPRLVSRAELLLQFYREENSHD